MQPYDTECIVELGVLMRNLFALPVVFFALLFSGPVWSDCIPIDTTPYTIESSGNYCLVQNVVASSDGIIVAADDVTLDCGDHTIDGSAQAPSRVRRGIVGYDKSGVLIQNCTVKGFMVGIQLSGVANHIRNNVLIAPYSRGIIVAGEETIIEGNRISDAGGATHSSWVAAFGILADGTSIIRENVVSGVVSTSGSGKAGYGIYTRDNHAGVIEGNTVRNVIGDSGQIALAVAAYSSDNAVLKENILVNPPHGYGYALYCSGTGSVSVGNVFQGFDQGISSCTSISPE